MEMLKTQFSPTAGLSCQRQRAQWKMGASNVVHVRGVTS